MVEENTIQIPRSETTRVAVRMVKNNGHEWLAICMEKMIRDKWCLMKSIQLLPTEWAQIREIKIAE